MQRIAQIVAFATALAVAGSGAQAGQIFKCADASGTVSYQATVDTMNRAGAIGRAGRGHDQKVSTYDKNLGRDLCR